MKNRKYWKWQCRIKKQLNLKKSKGNVILWTCSILFQDKSFAPLASVCLEKKRMININSNVRIGHNKGIIKMKNRAYRKQQSMIRMKKSVYWKHISSGSAEPWVNPIWPVFLTTGQLEPEVYKNSHWSE